MLVSRRIPMLVGRCAGKRWVMAVVVVATWAVSHVQAQQAPPATVPALPEKAAVVPAISEPAMTSTIVGTPFPYTLGGDQRFSGSVILNQDSFFGFYPILNLGYSITDKVALTFYGTFWTNPAFTPSGTGGTGLWTEVGGGFSVSLFDGALSINPQIGVLNGALLSGSKRSDAFEGLVTQISFSHASKYTEGQLYGAYYIATEAPSTNNFVHWWITGGMRPFADSPEFPQILSFGVHFEQLYRTKYRGGETGNIYTWLGPYVQVTLPNRIFFRVTGGWDLQDNVSGTFYKVSMGYVF
jgi:hypothetical protein